MKRIHSWAVLFLLVPLSLAAGCGKETGRVPFAGEGTADVTVPLAAGDVDFWTDLQIEHTGDALLQYQIELQQGGATVATATCNPLGNLPVKTGWVETNLGNSHSRSGTGKMPCSIKLPTAGPTKVKATLAFSQKPATLSLKKADLIVKQ